MTRRSAPKPPVTRGELVDRLESERWAYRALTKLWKSLGRRVTRYGDAHLAEFKVARLAVAHSWARVGRLERQLARFDRRNSSQPRKPRLAVVRGGGA